MSNEVSVPDKQNMRLWRDGLLSGEFEQGRGSLRQIEAGKYKYCCLGVATEIALRNGMVLSELDQKLMEKYGFQDVWACETAVLSTSVMKWLNIKDVDPVIDAHDTDLDADVCASAANDDLDWNFQRIAAGLTKRYKLDEDDEVAA